jgi:alkyl sulfatase BDS1-like metallo-beta-lactamase superfamily hydrolase
MLLDYIAIRINPEKAVGNDMTINLKLTDTSENYVLDLHNAALSNHKGLAENADLTLEIPRTLLSQIFLKQTTLKQAVKDKKATVKGDQQRLEKLLGMLDTFKFWFNIVTPNAPLTKQ